MGSWQAPSERFLYRQLKMLHNAGVLTAIVAARLTNNAFWNGIPVYGLNRKIHSSEKSELLSTPHLQTQLELLEAILLNTQADTILCQYGTLAELFLPVLQHAPQRLVIHFHGKDAHESMLPAGYRTRLEALVKRATVICSPYIYTIISEWQIPHEQIVVKTYGVEVPDSPVYRRGSTEVHILHLGRLIDCKSPDRTLLAFEAAKAYGMKGKLTIVGEGPLRATCEMLRTRSQWRADIEILGHVPQDVVDSLLVDADIFTQHSIKGEVTGQVEAFGVSIVEAMAASLPVVSCALGGIKHIVVNEQTGILVEPGDVGAHAKALIRLSRDPDLRNRMGMAGWHRAKQFYSYEAEQAQLLKILL